MWLPFYYCRIDNLGLLRYQALSAKEILLMKTLLIIVCCILLVNWGLDSNWGYGFFNSIVSAVGSVISIFVSLIAGFVNLLGTVLALGILVYIGITFGVAGVVGAALVIAVAATLSSIVSLFWPVLIVATLILLCSSKKKPRY